MGRDDLEIRDCRSVDVELPICGPMYHSKGPLHHYLGSLALPCFVSYHINAAQKILLGACHEIYVRLIALYHRTQDRHNFPSLSLLYTQERSLSFLVDVVADVVVKRRHHDNDTAKASMAVGPCPVRR